MAAKTDSNRKAVNPESDQSDRTRAADPKSRLSPTLALICWAGLLHLLLAATYLPSTRFSWTYLVPSLDVLVLLAPLFPLSWLAPSWNRLWAAGLAASSLVLAFVGFGNSIMQTYFPRPLELATDIFLIGSLKDLAEQSDRMDWFVGGSIALAVLTVIWGVCFYISLRKISMNAYKLNRRARLGSAAFVAGGIAILLVCDVDRSAGFPARTSAYLVRQVHLFTVEAKSFRPEDVERIRAERSRKAQRPGFLSRLGGRDVFVFLVEAYGEVAFGDPSFRSVFEPGIAEFESVLAEKDWHARSGYLISPVYGGNSWIADSAFACGIPVRTELRFRQLHEVEMPCMAPLFSKAGWETISMRPATLRDWENGDIYGFDRPIAGFAMKYFGPRYYWSPMPDQYALAWYQYRTLTEPSLKPGAPKLAYFQLTSSHAPFNRIPVMVDDWKSLVDSLGQDLHRTMVYSYPYSWWDLDGAEEGYLKAINYDFAVIREYLRLYAPEKFVAIILGDHQPASPITGERPFDVPIHVIADSPDVLGPMASWGMVRGMRPDGVEGKPMHSFLDYFLDAYSQIPTSH